MTITNVGSVPLDDVSVLNEFSRSLTPTRRSPVPQTWIGDDLKFDLGRLDPGQSSVLQVVYDPVQADSDAFCRARVTTPLGASDQTGIAIRVDAAPGTTPANPGNPIRIPNTPATGQMNVNVTSLDVAGVAVQNIARFQVSVENARNVSDQQVQITLLIPPGTQLLNPDPTQTGLRIRNQSPGWQHR